jgi:bacterioferritin
MLDGLPNLQDLGKLQVGERRAIEVLALRPARRAGCTGHASRRRSRTAKVVRDYVSRGLLQSILDDTEEHIDFLETQIDLVATVGEANWLQSQMGGGSERA